MKLGSWLSLLLVFFWVSAIQSADPSFSAADLKIRLSDKILKEISTAPHNQIPGALFRQASGIGIFPGIINVGVMVGIEAGNGVILKREENSLTWSNPAFFTFRSGSFGLQLGAQSVDLILLFMDKGSIQRLLEDKFILGLDASVSAGPLGRERSFETDLTRESQIFSYSKAKGLFLGFSLTGGVIEPDNQTNESFHGKDVSVQDILYDNAGLVTDNSRNLLETIKSLTK